jgi:hypothetical protein
MRNRAILATFLLSACSAACLATPATAAPGIGAFADPAGVPSGATEAAVTALEASLGQKLSVDSTFSNFNWTGPLWREQWDIAAGRMPMKSWGAGLYGVSCVLLTDVTAGKYDAQLKTQAALVKALRGNIWLRLFYGMPDLPGRACPDPTRSGPVFIAAWRHVVGLFRAAGVTNARWVWTQGEPGYVDNQELAFYPGSAWVDIVGEDVYNKTATAEPFAAAVCTVGPALGKPFAITETGAAGATNQLAWFANVKTACPGLAAFVYWYEPSKAQNYIITDPAAFAALRAIGTP